MITKWTLQNFKSFREAEISLAPITVFAGANSSGKSTIIQSMLLFKQTLQYAPASRALALNGPLLKLGQFSDVKNAAATESDIRIGWEISLEQTQNFSRFSYGPTPYSYHRPALGRSNIQSVVGDFSWELAKATAEIPDSIRELQPKLKSSKVSAVLKGKEKYETRKIEISRDNNVALDMSPSFSYHVNAIDDQSLDEILSGKPGGQIVAASPRHFLAGQTIISYDGVRERAYRAAAEIVGDTLFRYRPMPASLQNERMPHSLIEVIRNELIRTAIPSPSDLFGIADISEDNPITFRELVDIVGRANRASSFMRRNAPGKAEPLNLIALRDNIESILTDEFGKKTDQKDRTAFELASPSFVSELNEQVQTYFIAGLRYLGPLRDEPRPIYPLEALATPTEVGYKGEHTAAVLELHRDRTVRYVRPNDIHKTEPPISEASLHDAVVDWLEYVGVASEVRTSDHGKFGHLIQVQTQGVDRYHDLTNVGVGVSQVLPIIVMALLADPPAMLVFEQPELHLHPKVQARLADFFLSVALVGKQCVLETHSEYLVERFRLRIAQADGDSLTNIVKLYFTERQLGKTSCKEVKVSKYGAIEDWPEEFFDQANLETEGILRAAQEKRRSEKQSGKQ